MTAAMRRVLLIVGFIPVMLYAIGRWIATGRNIEDVVDAFIDWATP